MFIFLACNKVDMHTQVLPAVRINLLYFGHAWMYAYVR